jgi:23S rRNA (uracil1939-C5)-methyltransferase
MNHRPLAFGDKLDLAIEAVSHQGWGIGRHKGFAVFVPGGLPGEIVNVRIRLVKKNYAQGEIIRIIEFSPHRTEPICPVYGTCGGCHIQHTAYAHQLDLKREIVKNALQRIGRLKDVNVSPVLGMTNPWKYRNRIQLHVQADKEHVGIGLFKPGTHELVSFDKCRLIPDAFNDILSFLAGELNNSQKIAALSRLKHLVLKISSSTKEIAVVFVTAKGDFSLLNDLAKNLAKQFNQVTSIFQNVQKDPAGSLLGPKWHIILGKEKIEDKIDDLVFSMGPGSFVQVNPVQTRVLHRQILDYAELKGNETIIDNYCGVGTISLLLAKQAGRVIGIEEYREAVHDARYNAGINNLQNVEFIEGKTETVLPRMAGSGVRPDIVVVDPPRKGCDPVLLEAIAEMNPPKVIYVSCDPATLARDLKLLAEKGYRTRKVQPVDMFPQTMHVETVVLMSRK